MAGRDRAELEWAATVLRQALHVRAVNPHAQPLDSRVELQRHADGLTLLVPPAGIGRSQPAILLVALIWCSAVALAAIAAIAGGAGPGLLITLPHWAIGIGLLLAAIYLGRRRAVLAVVGDRLLVYQSGPFGGKRGEWAREQIGALCAGPSGTRENQRPILELQIHPIGGKKFGLLAGREAEELRWLAHVLGQSLRVPEAADRSGVGPHSTPSTV
jgi:hypothetical protein